MQFPCGSRTVGSAIDILSENTVGCAISTCITTRSTGPRDRRPQWADWAVQDTGDAKIFHNNIQFEDNTYIQGARINQFTWNNRNNNSFTQWQAYGFDRHGSAQ